MALNFPLDVRPFFPNPQTITYRTRIGGTLKSYTIDGVSVRPMRIDEVRKSNGAYVRLDRRFAFSTSELEDEGVTVNFKDTIIHRNKEYTIIPEMSQGEFHAHVKVVGRNLNLVYGLRDTISIWRDPIRGTDTQGRNLHNYQVFLANLQAKLQPMNRARKEEFGIPQLDRAYEVPVNTYEELFVTDQVRTTDGRILEIQEHQSLDTLDELPLLICADNGARWD